MMDHLDCQPSMNNTEHFAGYNTTVNHSETLYTKCNTNEPPYIPKTIQ